MMSVDTCIIPGFATLRGFRYVTKGIDNASKSFEDMNEMLASSFRSCLISDMEPIQKDMTFIRYSATVVHRCFYYCPTLPHFVVHVHSRILNESKRDNGYLYACPNDDRIYEEIMAKEVISDPLGFWAKELYYHNFLTTYSFDVSWHIGNFVQKLKVTTDLNIKGGWECPPLY